MQTNFYMEKAIRKRRKGGGRKLADGKISKTRLKREAIKWFTHNTSVEDFLRHVHISRQTYYRFLDKHPDTKAKVFELRNGVIELHKKQIEEMLAFLRENPKALPSDFYLKDIKIYDIVI